MLPGVRPPPSRLALVSWPSLRFIATYIISPVLHGHREAGLVGTERPLEMPPIPIHQKLSPPVAMERDGRCLPSPWQRAGTADRRIARLGKTFCSSQCRTVGGSPSPETGTWSKSTNFSSQEPRPRSSGPQPVGLLSEGVRLLRCHLCGLWQCPQRCHRHSLYPPRQHARLWQSLRSLPEGDRGRARPEVTRARERGARSPHPPSPPPPGSGTAGFHPSSPPGRRPVAASRGGGREAPDSPAAAGCHVRGGGPAGK